MNLWLMLLYPGLLLISIIKSAWLTLSCLLADASLADSVVLQQTANVASAGYRGISFVWSPPLEASVEQKHFQLSKQYN